MPLRKARESKTLSADKTVLKILHSLLSSVDAVIQFSYLEQWRISMKTIEAKLEFKLARYILTYIMGWLRSKPGRYNDSFLL